jgi:hypothetical protein
MINITYKYFVGFRVVEVASSFLLAMTGNLTCVYAVVLQGGGWGWGFLYWHEKDVDAYIHMGK